MNQLNLSRTAQTVLGIDLVTRDIDIIKGRSQCEVCEWHLVATAQTNEPAFGPEVNHAFTESFLVGCF